MSVGMFTRVMMIYNDHFCAARGGLIGGSGGPYVNKKGKVIAIGVENIGSVTEVILRCRKVKRQLKEQVRTTEKEDQHLQNYLFGFVDSLEEKEWISSTLIKVTEEMEDMTKNPGEWPLGLIIAKCTQLCSFLKSRGIDAPQIDKTYCFNN
jgi:hypothetical protein